MRYLTGNLKIFGKLLLVMYGLTALFLFFLAFLIQKLQPGEQVTKIGIIAVYVIVCFLGGFLAGKLLKSKKYLWGMFAAICYIIVMAVITLVCKGSGEISLSGGMLNTLLCLGSGMLGGMIS